MLDVQLFGLKSQRASCDEFAAAYREHTAAVFSPKTNDHRSVAQRFLWRHYLRCIPSTSQSVGLGFRAQGRPQHILFPSHLARVCPLREVASLRKPIQKPSSQKSKTGKQKATASNQKSEVRSPKSEVQGSESGSKDRVSGLWYLAALFFFALGLMSKPMLVTLPFLLLLLDYWPLQRLELKTPILKLKTLLPLLIEKLPFFALAAASCLVTFAAQKKRRGGDRVGRSFPRHSCLERPGFLCALLEKNDLAGGSGGVLPVFPPQAS